MPNEVYTALSVMTAFIALVLLRWALFRDRARGRRRCPKCWYDLRGTGSLTCSECGYVARREQHFFRTRRRWRWIAIVVALAIGARALWLVPKARREGWLSVMPTTVVIAAFPYVGYDSATELGKRWSDSTTFDHARPDLWGWQVRWAQEQASQRLGPNEGRLTRITMLDFIIWCDGDAPIGDTILAWLNDADPQLQATAALYVGGTFNLSPVEETTIESRLCAMMKNPNVDLRRGAARGLLRFINEDQAALSLLVCGLEDPDHGVRSECARSLGRLHQADPSLIARLADIVRSRDPAAPAAAESLGAIGDASAIPVLVGGIESPGLWLRRECVASLVALQAGSPETVASLMAMLQNTDSSMRGAAIAALISLNGVPIAEMDRITATIDVDATAEIINNLGADHPFEPDIIVPILNAMVKTLPESGEGMDFSTGPYEVAIAMMARYPKEATGMLPTILPLLQWNQPWARRAVISTIGAFGAVSADALPQLRKMLDETTNPHEMKLLRDAIASIEKDLSRR